MAVEVRPPVFSAFLTVLSALSVIWKFKMVPVTGDQIQYSQICVLHACSPIQNDCTVGFHLVPHLQKNLWAYFFARNSSEPIRQYLGDRVGYGTVFRCCLPSSSSLPCSVSLTGDSWLGHSPTFCNGWIFLWYHWLSFPLVSLNLILLFKSFSDYTGGPACCRGGNAVNSCCFIFDYSARGVNIHPYLHPLPPTHHSTESGAQRRRSGAWQAADFLACYAFLFAQWHTI